MAVNLAMIVVKVMIMACHLKIEIHPFFSKVKEDDCYNDEETVIFFKAHRRKQGLVFLSLGNCRNSEFRKTIRIFQAIYYPRNSPKGDIKSSSL